jgi:hypothetical protein
MAGKRRRRIDVGPVPHRARPEITPGQPVLVKLKMLPHVPALQGKKTMRIVTEAFEAASDRLGVKVRRYSVREHRIHLIVEPDDEASLWRAMKGLSVRLARGLNRLSGGDGRVMADRYEVKVLSSEEEVEHVVAGWNSTMEP